MPQRVNAKSDIGTSKTASDSYDTNNIFLTDQGWVYRHWKGDPSNSNSRYWDEIIVAGQVIDPASIDPPIDNGVVTKTDYTVDANNELVGSKKYPYTLSSGYEPSPGAGVGGDAGTPDGEFDLSYAGSPHTFEGAEFTPLSTNFDADGNNTIAEAQATKNENYPTLRNAGSSAAYPQYPDLDLTSSSPSNPTPPATPTPPAVTLTAVVLGGPAGSASGDTETYTKGKNGSATDTVFTLSSSNVSDSVNGMLVTFGDEGSRTLTLTGESAAAQKTETDTMTVTVSPAVRIPTEYVLNLTNGNSGSTAYLAQIDGGAITEDPTITMFVGDTLVITNNCENGAHPVNIIENIGDGSTSTTQGTFKYEYYAGTESYTNQYPPVGSPDVLMWDTTGAAPGTYYYQCTAHADMNGVITLTA